MKQFNFLTICKLMAAPLWVPIWIQLWLIKKLWRYIGLLFLFALASCTSTSNQFPHSPCACDFQPINIVSTGDKENA